MSFKKVAIDSVDLVNKRVVARVDFNVPLKNGVISNTQRIDAAIPTIKYALEKGAKVCFLKQKGRRFFVCASPSLTPPHPPPHQLLVRRTDVPPWTP
jgi:3-phosphoglycerate kinase